jgi:hypothetical protein
MTASTIISIISLGFCILSFAYCKAYLRKRTGQERILAEFKEEVYKLIAEIDAATDRDTTLIEDRIKSLKTLLEDVDKRMNLHAQELNRRRNQEAVYAELGRKRMAEPVSAYTAPVAGNVQTERASLPQEEPPQLPGAPTVTIAPEIKPKPPSLTEQVTELARAGFSPNLIATKLEVSISEVELVIALAEQKRGLTAERG